MRNIIQINKSVIGQESVNSVNARDLWKQLGVGKDFSSWIKQQIERLKLVENKHYIVYTVKGENPTGGRPQRDYIVDIDTAKMIAMMENNTKGDEVRKYFIEVEKKANKPMDILDMVIYSAQQLKQQQQAFKLV